MRETNAIENRDIFASEETRERRELSESLFLHALFDAMMH